MPEKERVQFDFTPDQLAEIDALREKLGAATRAELVRRALRAYGLLAEFPRQARVEITDGGQTLHQSALKFLL